MLDAPVDVPEKGQGDRGAVPWLHSSRLTGAGETKRKPCPPKSERRRENMQTILLMLIIVALFAGFAGAARAALAAARSVSTSVTLPIGQVGHRMLAG